LIRTGVDDLAQIGEALAVELHGGMEVLQIRRLAHYVFAAEVVTEPLRTQTVVCAYA